MSLAIIPPKLRAAALRALAVSMCGFALPAAGHDAARPLAGALLITGSSTMAPLVAAMAERFRAIHPGVRIDVQTGGSGRGIADVRARKADIGMASRALGAVDADLHGLPVARDGVAIVVHKDNPVRALGASEVVGIYTGRLTRWKQLGGRDAAIVVAAADAGRGSSELFAQYFRLARSELRLQRTVGDNAERMRLLVEQPDAIVYMSVGEAERSVQAGAPLRPLPVAGVAATSRNILTGNYPIARPLSLVTRGRPSGLAAAFIDFCVSSQVTDLVVAHDFVPYLD